MRPTHRNRRSEASPDLGLRATSLDTPHTKMRLPPSLSYIAIDYYKQPVQVKGTRIEIDGPGDCDRNFYL